MKQPIVSIVTPSFNQAAFLEDTIQSVLQQTYPHIEYIIIDGGSTDGSVDIIKKYAHKLHYWQSRTDSGQSNALNQGFGRGSGQLFAYINSDDLLEPKAVENIAEAYERHPGAAIIYGKCTHINEQGKAIGEAYGAAISYEEMLTYMMLPKIHQPTCFFNREFLKRTPLFREDLDFVMDYELILSLMKKYPVYFIDQKIARYRYHPSAKSVSKVKELVREKMRIQREYGPEYRLLWIWRYIKHRIKWALFKR